MTREREAINALIRDVVRLRREVREQGRASQGAFRSVELSQGSPSYYDDKGDKFETGIDPGSGAVITVPVTPKPPAVPTAPDAIAVQGGINIVWDGTFVGANWNENVAYVEIHRGIIDGFPAIDVSEIGTFSSYYGGERFFAALPEEGEQFFRLVTVDRYGRRSVASATDSATALRIQPTTDGESPATSPDATLRGGIGALFASWTAINNEDPVTYEVHIAQDNAAFVPVPGGPTMVAETDATSASIRAMPDGSIFMYDSVYTVKIIAKDHDGAAAPGAGASASLMAITNGDIAVDYAYAGTILANQITGGQINASLLIAGLLQTATSGGRVEMGPFGIRIYDSNGVDINVDLNGLLNRFRGSIEATDIIIRDALQMFGTQNRMGPGSVLTLKSTSSAPGQAPGQSWEYEEGPAIQTAAPGLGGMFCSAAYRNSVSSEISGTSILWHACRLFRGNKYYLFPTVGYAADGAAVSSLKAWAYTRIAIGTGVNDERAVTLGEIHTAATAAGAYPDLYLHVWNDNAMATDGSVAPINTAFLGWGAFSWFRTYAVVPFVRTVSPPRNWFGVLSLDTFAGTNPAAITFQAFSYDEGAGAINYHSVFSGALTLLDENEKVAGGAWFSDPADVGLEGLAAGSEYVLVMTNRRNIVWNLTTNAWTTAEFPTTFSAQDEVMVSGNPKMATASHFYSFNWAAGSDIKSFKYENNYKAVSENWWASFAWRGEASTIYRTEDSARTSIPYRRRARLKITVPALPAPVAGVGAARDPAKDPYGWVYYLGRGASEPTDSNMYLQPVQPTMVPSVPLAQTSITKADYPTWSGANPNVASTFPASTPAKIVSDNGIHYVDGNGNAKLNVVEITDLSVLGSGGTGWPALFNNRAVLCRRGLGASFAGMTNGAFMAIGLDVVHENIGGVTYNPANGEFNIPVAGRYRLTGKVMWTPFSSAGRRIGMIYVNGVAVDQFEGFASTTSYSTCLCDVTKTLAAGDKIKLVGFQNSGIAGTIYGDAPANACSLQIERVI